MTQTREMYNIKVFTGQSIAKTQNKAKPMSCHYGGANDVKWGTVTSPEAPWARITPPGKLLLGTKRAAFSNLLPEGALNLSSV